jgi:hypothetical protein
VKYSRLIQRTAPLREWIVRQLAPTIYQTYKMYLALVKRPMITFLHVRFGEKALVGVEIGVAQGFNALTILETLNIRQLYLVDPYEPYTDWGNKRVEGYVLARRESKVRLAKYRNIQFIYDYSTNAVNQIPDDLDFVYIDGNHSYPFVKKDIELYYPKIKSRGVIGGHDYAVLDVQKAVREFAEAHNDEIVHTQLRDWWIIKS